MKTEKMVKTAKALDKVFKILQRVIIIFAAVSVIILGIFTVMNAVNHNAVIGTDFNIVNIGPLTFELAEEAAPDNNAILIYTWIMAAIAVAFIVIVHYVLGTFRKILKPMTEGNPFAPSVSKEIRKIAFASLAVGVIYNVMAFVEALNAIRIFELNRLLQNSQIQSVVVNFHFDVTFVIVFFVLLLVSYIFRYGEELQKLSDETL